MGASSYFKVFVAINVLFLVAHAAFIISGAVLESKGSTVTSTALLSAGIAGFVTVAAILYFWVICWVIPLYWKCICINEGCGPQLKQIGIIGAIVLLAIYIIGLIVTIVVGSLQSDLLRIKLVVGASVSLFHLIGGMLATACLMGCAAAHN